jgi:hypothetical protein
MDWRTLQFMCVIYKGNIIKNKNNTVNEMPYYEIRTDWVLINLLRITKNCPGNLTLILYQNQLFFIIYLGL